MTSTPVNVLENASTDPNMPPDTAAVPCDNALEMTFWILNGTAGFIVAIGNITTLIVLVTRTRLRQQMMNAFLGSLAVADVGMGLLVVPGYGVYCSGCTYSLSAYCWVLKGPKDLFFAASLTNLLAITYDRYTAVKRPLYYSAKMTPKRVLSIVSVVWGVALMVAVGPNFWQHTVTPEENKAIASVYYATLVFVLVIIPIIILLVANSIIISAIRQQIRQIEPNENAASRAESIHRKKGTISCVLVVLIFVIAWIPRTAYNLMNLFFGLTAAREPVFLKVSLFFLILQSAVNPFIYSFLRRDFRQAAMRLFKCEKA